jgi:uncharacterized protein YcnI
MKARRVAVLVAAGALIAPAAAQAHISVHPNTIPAGAFVTLDIRVPGEQAGAHVTKIDTLFPSGLTSADFQNVPGWSTQVIYQRLAKPIQTADGAIDTEVSQMIWTWVGPLGRVDNNQFINFPLSVAIPGNDAGQSLAFKTVQTYSNGQVVHWIGPASADQPAPTVNITRAGGVIQDVAGAEAGPAPGELPSGQGIPTPTPVKATRAASNGLAIAALVVGALGLLAAVAALVSLRARPRAGA